MPSNNSKYTFTLKFEKKGLPHVWGTLDGPGMHTTMGLVPGKGNVLGLGGPGEIHNDIHKGKKLTACLNVAIKIDEASAKAMNAYAKATKNKSDSGELRYSYPSFEHCVAAINDLMAVGRIGSIDQHLKPEHYQKIGPVMSHVVHSDARRVVSESPKVADVMARLGHLISQISLPRNKARALTGVQDYIASELLKGKKSPQTIAYEIVADRLGANIGNLSAERDISSVVDPVQDALGKAGYGPANPDKVADAYVDGRASGLTHEEAVEYAAGVARDAAASYEADVRALKGAASWNAPVKKNEEQKGNIAPRELEEWLSDVLNLVERTPTAGGQVASLGAPDFVTDLIGANPAAGGFKRAQGRAQSAQTPWSQSVGPFDLAAQILGVSRPETVSTPIGEVVVGYPDWVTDYEIENGLMSHPAYTNASLPQSKPVRDTVTGFYTSAYPGTVTLDATGRIDLGPRVSRPASAPGLFQGRASVARPAEPVPTAIISRAGLADRQQAISAGVKDTGSLWSAVQKETESRRAAELERDRKELERAYGIEQRRDAAARASGDVVPSVSPTKTDTLGGVGSVKEYVKEGLLGAEEKAVRAAQAARNRAQTEGIFTGDWGSNTLAGGAGGDSLGDASSNSSHSGWGGRGQHGAEDFVPGGNDDTKAPAGLTGVVTSGSGKAVKSRSGHVVTTGTHLNPPSTSAEPDARVICTELVAQGRMPPDLYHLDLRFAEECLSAVHLCGYHLWAVPVVRWMRRSPRVSAIIAGPALWRAEELAHLLGARARGSLRGKLVRLIGEPLCWLLGLWAPATDYRKLYEQETNA